MAFPKRAMERDLHLALKNEMDKQWPLYRELVERGIANRDFDEIYQAMDTVIAKVEEVMIKHLFAASATLRDNYIYAKENPHVLKYKFHSDTLTIGKLYLMYLWAFCQKKGNRYNVIDLDNYFITKTAEIRKELLDNCDWQEGKL